ncbi:hypothetical protein B0J17DRAFT_763440 [Rhizoctonia solani]|nr:hypothetical protein B0J17DRAFT_763440 [Rhizoctonia solani]
MLFSSKSIVIALVAFVTAVGAVPTALDERCHSSDRVCNPHTAATCPRCCFPEQCSLARLTAACTVKWLISAYN